MTTATRERLYLYDTTLRDGAQTAGIEFSLEDKIAITAMIEELGIDYLEGGFPGANTIDTEFFDRRRTSRARFAAFGMAKRSGRSIDNDRAVAGAIGSVSDAVCFVSKSSRPQVEIALGIPPDENLANLRESIVAGLARGKEVLIDAEHFFDGYKADRDYATRFIDTALAAGARWVVLCDTNGGTLPEEIERIVGELVTRFPGDRLGIHAHDDTGNAIANSLAAVRAGVRQVQGTLNGIGERCGNASLTTLIPTLVLKPAYAGRFETGVTPAALARLTQVSRAFDDRLNRAPNRHAPYVGASAFATKAGIHASALAKDSSTYEHVPPESIGNERVILVSQQAGRSNLLPALARIGIDVRGNDDQIDALLQAVKDKAAEGYSYEGADASFKLLALRTMGRLPDFFRVDFYRTSIERRRDVTGELSTITEAVVKLDVGGEPLMSVAEGNGPVNALDRALRKDLGRYSDRIADLELVDYKVRILNGGTGAVTRVLVESRDGEGERWMTIGVSANIIDASFEALYESIVYKLLKTERVGAYAPPGVAATV